MKNNLHTLIVGAERLKRNPVEFLSIKIHIAHTYLDLARTTSDGRSRMRSVQRAANIAESIRSYLDEHLLLERADLRRGLAELQARIVVGEPKWLATTEAAIKAVAVASGLARGDMIHFFVPTKQALFAGDLSAIAMRLRFSDRIHAC